MGRGVDKVCVGRVCLKEKKGMCRRKCESTCVENCVCHSVCHSEWVRWVGVIGCVKVCVCVCLPRIQLIAEGFLSVHMLPLIATRTESGKVNSMTSMAFRHPFETMFIPMASPDIQQKRRYTLRPAMVASTLWSFP